MNKADREHLSNVQALGCIACRVIGYVDTPAEIHHMRAGQGKSQRNDNFHVLPLCPHHHRTGSHGEAFHAGKQTWQDKFGTEDELLEAVNKLLESEQ
jgi:hypothetical protein